jgi:glycosyltransferase involved in cell wall biosynthesis
MTKAMRIGMYTSALPQPGRKPGGVDIFVDRLAEQLAQRGHRVTMFSYSALPGDRSYELCRLSPAATANSPVKRLVNAPLRLNRLNTSELDILHLHGDDWFFTRRTVPTVRTFHGSALYEARTATGRKRSASQYVIYGLEFASARLATRTYSVTPDPAIGYRVDGHLNLAYEAPPAIDSARAEDPTVLFVGTWLGRKRGKLLHDAFQRDVRTRIPDARLVMVSDHCEPGPGVEWHRRPSDEELSRLYGAAWVFCLPSAYEGFGIPYLEAMAHGTAVVSTANPGSRYVLDDGRAGVLARDGELGSVVAELLSDAERRQTLIAAGAERAAAFRWHQVLDEHEQAYVAAVAAFGR